MENTFYTEHIPLRTHEIQDTIFGEHVPFSFFIRGRKFYACFTNMTNLRRKKKDLKIRFLEYGAVVKTRRSVLLFLYTIYIYIK